MKIFNCRKCIATGIVKPKIDLIRIVKLRNNQVLVNSNQGGRGAYISKDKSLINILLKKKLLNRAFKFDVPKSVYEELSKLMED